MTFVSEPLFAGKLVGLGGGEDQGGVVGAIFGSGHFLAILHVGRFVDVAGVVGQIAGLAFLAERDAAGDGAAVAAIEDGGEADALIESGIEDAGDFAVASDRKSTRLNSSHRCISYAV